MISGIELAKIGIKVIIEEINNNVILKMLDKNYKTIASFQANKRNEINITDVQNKKYEISNNRNYIMAMQNFNNYQELLWHRRIGHYYNEDMQKYLQEHGINNNNNCCDECKITKMKRKSLNRITPKASHILEVIHSDIIGPINKSFTRKRFILTFIDEFSRKSWIFLLKSKSEAIDTIIEVFKFLNNNNNYKIKFFKSDQGCEFDNKKIKNFCKENGILKVFSLELQRDLIKL